MKYVNNTKEDVMVRLPNEPHPPDWFTIKPTETMDIPKEIGDALVSAGKLERVVEAPKPTVTIIKEEPVALKSNIGKIKVETKRKTRRGRKKKR